MAEDQDRAARIRELKAKHPLLTWAKIAQETGVTERSAIKWQTTGALKPENAEALARLFGVDFDYVWIGPRPDTPELFVDRRNNSKPVGPVAVDKLEGDLGDRVTAMERTLYAIEADLRQLRDQREQILETVRREIRDAIHEPLEVQTAILQRIEGATAQADDAAGRLGRIVEEAAAALRSGPRSPAPAKSRPASAKPAKRSPRASSRDPQ